MKIEQLIVQYLYNNKTVTLQDIGSFTISPDIIIPADNDKEEVLPEGAINFVHDPKAKLDDGLVDFVMQQTRKIKPLATSDLESYSILSKQFLNIGKPMIIEGLGTLLKNQQGGYEFSQSHTSNARIEPIAAQIKEKTDEKISFSSPAKKQPSKKGFAIFLVIILVALIAGALYYFLKKTDDNGLQKVEPPKDTLVTTTPSIVVTDTTKKDSIVKNPILADTTKIIKPANDGYTFKVIIKEYPSKEAAQKAYTRLTNYGHTIILSTLDSTHYRLAIPFTTPLSDTLRAKDSLAKFFQAKTIIDRN
ncbi:MAG: hypothetical protein ABI091_01730 [Ferruginibacter sp.]